MSNNNSGMGFFEWLIIVLIACGLFGVGPCAGDCAHCGPQLVHSGK